MKVVVGRSAMRLEEAIPDWAAKYPGYTFEACLGREDLPAAIQAGALGMRRIIPSMSAGVMIGFSHFVLIVRDP